jgi:hypothetical protein
MLSEDIKNLEAALRCSGVLRDFPLEWQRIKTALVELQNTPTNKQSTPCCSRCGKPYQMVCFSPECCG